MQKGKDAVGRGWRWGSFVNVAWAHVGSEARRGVRGAEGERGAERDEARRTT